MKNLQNFSIQELSAKEIRETDGGFLGILIVIGCCLLLTNCNGCESDTRRESDGPPPPSPSDGYQY